MLTKDTLHPAIDTFPDEVVKINFLLLHALGIYSVWFMIVDIYSASKEDVLPFHYYSWEYICCWIGNAGNAPGNRTTLDFLMIH